MSNSKADIKILISCHKPTIFVLNDILKPIQLNCAKQKNRFPKMLRDNDGDNISDLNPMYCELTAQYWAWKNLDADYYGFFHYRRYLSFKGKNHEDIYGNVVEDYIDDGFVEKYGLDEESISKTVCDADIVLPNYKNIKDMPNMGKNMYDQYVGSGYLHIEDIHIMLDVLKEKYPDFMPYANKFMDGHMSYLNNMYIMKKEIFHNYCKWLFDILAECHKRIDYTDYSTEAIRTIGHLAERLFNIYVLYLKDNNPDLKIKELQTVFVMNTDPVEELAPAFKNNNVPIIFSANDFYRPYLSVVLESIVENSNIKNNYDIIVMNKDITNASKKRLLKIVSNKDNFSLRFLNIGSLEGRFKKLFLRGHFTIETWFRLLMPETLPEYKKVLYMDADLVVNNDVAKLYNTNIDGYLLGACHDADTAGLYNGYEPTKKKYMDDILKIKKPYNYFQAGVLLFNLEEFRKQLSTNEMIEFAASYDWELLDQDVLNYLAQDKVKFVDMAWNVMYDWLWIRRKEIISFAPKYLQDEYDEAHSNPYVIHYAGPDKPWNDPSVDYADLFWKYARNTCFYEELIARMADVRCSNPGNQNRSIVKRAAKKIIKKALPADSKRGKFARNVYRKIRK